MINPDYLAAQAAARRPHVPVHLLDAGSLPDLQVAAAGQELLAAERHATLREALSRLPPDGQQLIALLIADPPVPYAEISTRLGIPVGSIGPKRSRCLDRLRRDPALTSWKIVGTTGTTPVSRAVMRGFSRRPRALG